MDFEKTPVFVSLVVILLALAMGLPCAQAQPEPFTIVVLPDTQNYTNPAGGGQPEMFTSQTQWIVDNTEALNIAFVLHEGDITNNNDTPGWENAKASLDLLDGVVPYALAVGNHDGLGASVGDTDLFNTYFPVSKFEGLPSFGGVFEAGKMDNCYHLFSAGGVDWLVLSLEFGPRDVVLTWANQVVADHPDHQVILVTHTHIYSDDEWHGSLPEHNWVPSVGYGRENDGDHVWDEFLRHHPNISFTFNGHVLNDGQGRRVDIGDYGNKVHQMLCNFQNKANGGNGFLRIIKLFPGEDRFAASSYSPWLDEHWIDPWYQFEHTNLGIFEDTYRPQIETVMAMDDSHVQVSYSELVDQVSSTAVANYAIDGVEITDAVLQSDQKTVLLTTAALTDCVDYTLTVNDVFDRATPPNPIESDSQHSFTFRQPLMEDDFEDGDMSGWVVVDEGENASPSDWRVVDGRLVQHSNIYGPSVPAESEREGTFAYWDADLAIQTWDDYVFTVELGSPDNDGIGVMFRYQDPFNYYKVDLDDERNFRKLFRMKNGTETTLATVSAGYGDEAMLLTVEAQQDTITVKLDGVDVFTELQDADGLDTGTVALYSWGSEGAWFDNVKVVPGTACPCPDTDSDGHTDEACGGDDCDDDDGDIHPGAEEVCSDLKDNDCDTLTDYDDGDDCPEILPDLTDDADVGDDGGADDVADWGGDVGDAGTDDDADGGADDVADSGGDVGDAGADAGADGGAEDVADWGGDVGDTGTDAGADGGADDVADGAGDWADGPDVGGADVADDTDNTLDTADSGPAVAEARPDTQSSTTAGTEGEQSGASCSSTSQAPSGCMFILLLALLSLACWRRSSIRPGPTG